MVGASGVLDSPRTKNQIITILSETWPLSAKEIYNQLQRKHSFLGSYQAVHKMVQQMTQEGILEKQENKHQISTEWAKNFSTFAKHLEEKLKVQNQGNMKTINFNCFIEFGKYLINDFFTEKEALKKTPCACFWNHAYPVVGASEEEHNKMKTLFSNQEHYAVSTQDTYLDRLTSDYTRTLGKKSITGKKYTAKIDTFVEGNKIMQVYLPKELEDEMDKVYSQIKSEKDFKLEPLLELGTKKHKIKAIIFENKELAESLREEIRKLYTEANK